MFSSRDFVNAYLKHGLKPIPLYWGTKKPIGKQWNIGWSRKRCQESFKKYPGANIGVLLGDIMDVEGDSPEANKLLNEVCSGIDHPKYKSLKSIHHLFRSPDPKITIAHFKKIEFRGSNHQSVFPPSQHESGKRYEWIEWCEEIPEMPKELRDVLKISKIKKKKSTKEKVKFNVNHVSKIIPTAQYLKNNLKFNYDVKPGHSKLWCPVCENIQFLHSKRLHFEFIAFKTLGFDWSCSKCRDVDVRELVRSLRKETIV